MSTGSQTKTEVSASRLARKLNTTDAVFIGLGSMIGAGIFSAPGPAAAAAGSGLLLAIFFAAGLASLNALTMAQLAAVFPESGGAYVYGRKILGPAIGFLAGWSFVVGKLASCTAMALTFASYAFPEHLHLTAVAAVFFCSFINYLGVKKTAFATKILTGFVLMALALVAFASLSGGAVNFSRLNGWTDRGGLPGILEATGLMFFAFAGYARIATLGEEVIDPRRTIPRAILIALVLTVAIYALITTAALLTVDIDSLATSKTPLSLAASSGKFANLTVFVRLGACFASLGVLLSLLAGIGRTSFAMAANRDLPFFLAAVHRDRQVPHRAELTVGIIVALIVSFVDLRAAIGFSSFAILIYYAIANAAAWKLRRTWRPISGFFVCIIIAFSLPPKAILGGIGLLLLGLLIHHCMRRNLANTKF